jgi:nitrite reductase (NADH) large subunit
MSINRLQRPRLVVVGNGMAGMRTVEELVARAPDRFDITVIGGEPHPSYNRILLSSALAGERTLAEIVIQPSSWYDKHGIHFGRSAMSVPTAMRRFVALIAASAHVGL